MKVRQDAWSHEDDLLLAETVLRYIRDGGTQLAAFEEVGDALNRTSAACGFRWNAEVRKKYEPAVAIAKKQRKERKRSLEKQKKELEKAVESNKTTLQMEWLPAPTGIYPATKFSDSELEKEEIYVPLIEKSENITLDDCIHYLQNMKHEQQSGQGLQLENERLLREYQLLKGKNQELEQKLAKLEQQQSVINEDYEMLVQIMDRAKKMTSPQDEVI